MPTAIFEPLFHYFRWAANDPFSPRRSDDQTDKAVQRLYRAFLPIASDPTLEDEERREAWITLDRGKPEDWCTYESYCEDAAWDSGSAPTKEDWLNEWMEWFPDETYWHLILCNRYKDWITISVDNRVIIQTSPEEQAPYHDELIDKYLIGLAEKVDQAVTTMRAGKYAQQIKESLPFDRRYGLIQRKKLWEVAEGDFDRDWDLNAREAHLLADALRAQPSEQDVGRIASLTTGQYFDALKIGYQATGRNNENDWFNGIPAEDGRAWYARFGDARDQSLLDIDPKSREEFEKWYSDNQHRFGHNFEIFLGRGCSRVHMNPEKDTLGWYCRMGGSITWHASDMARVWKTVNAAGIPVFMYDAEALANALVGEDWILIVPRHLPCDYTQGMFFGREVRTAIPLFEEHRDEIIRATEWQEPKISQLDKTL